MVSRQDERLLNRKRRQIRDAIDELEQLVEIDERDSVMIEDSAFEQAQEEVKTAVTELFDHVDDMIDRTDVLEDSNGNVIRTLPNPGIERGTDTTYPPAGGGDSGGGGGDGEEEP